MIVNDNVIIQISGRNQDFFRLISKAKLIKICQMTDLNDKHHALWKYSSPCAIDSTGYVEYIIVDNQDDPELTKESWIELIEELKDEQNQKGS